MYWNGDINWYSPAEIGEQIIVNSSQRKITKLGLEKSSAKMLPKGTVLFTSRAGIGNTAILGNPACTNQGFQSIIPNTKLLDTYFIFSRTKELKAYGERVGAGSTFVEVSGKQMTEMELLIPKLEEQKAIGCIFKNIDNLITLHQQKNMKGKNIMKNLLRKSELFYEYYEKWISVYKVGAIRDVTMKKYKLTLNWLKKLVPTLEIKDLTRITYQQLLNDYAECHEKQSTMDFHHQLKGAILDAVDEGIIIRDPTRKAIIKGKIPKEKKIKYLNQFELQKLIADLDLGTKINYDWLILLIAKTGMRFSEALAITPKDFDFPHQMIIINKTWDYKGKGGFLPTKNTSSNRKVQLDWQTAIQFSELIKELDEDKPIFFTEKIYNSTINDILERHCKNVNIPTISVHGLRHTHASILLFAGVSIASVAHRLGHSSMTTTQKTYLHIIQELENTDIDLIMRSLTALNR